MYQLTREDTGNPEGLNQYIKRSTLPSPYEVLPGMYAQTSIAMELNWRLYNLLSERLPPSASEGALLSYPGVPDEWSRLLNVMGVAHNPEGVPPFSTAGYHAVLKSTEGKSESNISRDLDRDGDRRARWLAKRMVQRSRLLPLHIKRVVVTGIPHMTQSYEAKYSIVRSWHAKYKEYAALMQRGDLRRLADDHDVYFAYFTGRRYQPDKVKIVGGRATGKDRVVLDWNGRWVVADKTLPDIVQQGPHRDKFLCCRSRKISASPLPATYPLRALAKEIEGHFDAFYAFTFYHTGADDVSRKSEGRKGLFMLDVDNHDVNMPPALREIFCDAVAAAFGRLYGEYVRMTLRMPQLIHNDYRFGKGVKLQGDPFARSTFTADYVNPSGHPCTSLLAKFAGAFFAYDGLVRAGYVDDTEEALDALLRGELSVAFLNAGDNLAVMGIGSSHEKLAANSPFCIYSTTTTFQGLVAMATSSGRVVWVPNIASYAINFFTPGRPIGHPQRGHWANGWLERAKVYAAAPSYATAQTAVNEAVDSVLGMSMDEYAELRKQHVTVVGRSLVDAEFMLDPDVVYYKRHAEEVSDDVLMQVYFVVEPREYADMHEWLITQQKGV